MRGWHACASSMATTRTLAALIVALSVAYVYSDPACYSYKNLCVASPQWLLSLQSSKAPVDEWLKTVYTSQMFCNNITDIDDCWRNSTTVHACVAINATVPCVSNRISADPDKCLSRYLKQKFDGPANLTDGSVPCDLVALQHNPCLDLTWHSGACSNAEKLGCVWSGGNPDGVSLSYCTRTDNAQSLLLGMLDLGSEYWDMITEQNAVCKKYYNKAGGCVPEGPNVTVIAPATAVAPAATPPAAAINFNGNSPPVILPPGVFNVFQQCGGTAGNCSTMGYGCVDKPFPNTSCMAGTTCSKVNAFFWQCNPPKGGVSAAASAAADTPAYQLSTNVSVITRRNAAGAAVASKSVAGALLSAAAAWVLSGLLL